MKARRFPCAIEDLAIWHPYLYVEPYVVAFVAVTGQYSVSPARFFVEFENVRFGWLGNARLLTLEVSWTEETIDKAERLRCTMAARSLVEFAAISVALLLVRQVIPLGTLNVIEHGGRADYRSTQVRRVLEVSGTENLAELRRRQREKAAQALANPFCWDAYVTVCAFGAEGHHALVSGHRWEDSPYAQA